MNATTIQLSESVAAFADAVREQLDDLTAEQIEDLTDGLEADLAEGAVDRSGAFEPGDALEYARELRASAGLPPRESRRISLSASMAGWRAGAAGRIRSSKFGAGLLDFLLVLRPAWWALRGWALYTFIALWISRHLEVLPSNIFAWLFLLAFVAVSVQWGRGLWLPKSWLTPVRSLANTFAIIGLMIIAGSGLAASPTDATYDSQYTYGLWYDGEQIQNIFAYDAAGHPLEFVQLYTDRGEPLTTLGARGDEFSWMHYTDDGSRLVQPVSDAGSTAWNVFPLYSLAPQFGVGQGKEQLPQLPFEQARPLVGAENLVQTCEAPPEAELPEVEE